MTRELERIRQILETENYRDDLASIRKHLETKYGGKSEIRSIREIGEKQLSRADRLLISNEAIREILEQEISPTLSDIRSGVWELCSINRQLLEELTYHLAVQQETLEEIRDVLARPLDTQAKELRLRGEDAYWNGWYDEAEIDMIESLRKNYQDFYVHHLLGNIYCYHKNNFAKASDCYVKAAKYSTPRSKEFAGVSLFHAA